MHIFPDFYIFHTYNFLKVLSIKLKMEVNTIINWLYAQAEYYGFISPSI